jgi:hypothetical protein
MFINVSNANQAGDLNSAMSSGNCIVLYHMSTCPHCVNMMPEWNKFKSSAPKLIPGLTIGEVERQYIDMIPDAGVESFPTIKFYKAGSQNSANNNSNKPAKASKPANIKYPPGATSGKLINLLRNMMLAQQRVKQAEQVPGELVYEDARTANNLLKFARNNIVRDKTKKAQALIRAKVKKTLKRQLANKKSKKTKSATRPANLSASMAKLSAKTLPKYKKAKANDANIVNKISNSLGLS